MFRDLKLKFPLITLLTLGLIMSCSNKVEDINETTAASSFVNTPVQLVGNIEHKSLWSDSAWNDLSNIAIYKFKTCLKDKAINNAIIDEPFSISTPLGSKVVTSDVNGCLVWSEKLDFNILEQERLIEFPVSINGLGHYKGTRNFNLAINPWPNSSSPMIFLDNDTETASHFGLYSLNEKNEELSPIKENIIISNLAFSAKPSKMLGNMKHYPTDIQFNASIATKGLNGENKRSLSISKGRFEAEFKIFERPENTEENYLVASDKKELSALNGKFEDSLNFYLDPSIKLNDRSFYFMQIELRPLNAPAGLSKEEIIQVTDFNLETGSIGLVNRNQPRVVKSIRPQLSLPDPSDSQIIGEEIQGDDKLGFYIKKVTNISRGSIVSGNFNQSSIKRRRAKFTLCLNEETSSSSQVPLSDTEVKVDISFMDGTTDVPDKPRVYKTNEDGCLDSYANITYDRYSLERWIPFNVKVTPITGTYQDLVKTRKLTVNPWNPEDFGYDTKFETQIPEIQAEAPRVFVGKVDYKKEMMDYSQFRINEFLHLSLKRKYQFSFSPKVQLFHSYNDETSTEAITFGEYNVKISLFSPNSPDVDYYSPDLSQFRFITSAKKDVKVLPNGTVTDLIAFPFLVSETQDLAHKNLAIMEITPKDSASSIRPVKVVFPFFGGNQGAQMPAIVLEKEIASEITAKINSVANHGKYLPTIDVIGDPSVDPMANFTHNFKKAAKELNSEAIVKDMRLDEFNKSAPIANWERVKLPKGKSLKDKVELTKRELRTLVTENAKIYPKGILSKLCRHFYDLPGLKRETRLFQRVTTYDGGEQFANCEDAPNEHFKVTPIMHIRKILSRRPERREEAYASFVKSTRGQVSRGNAFFAAYGDRSSSVSGEREGESRTTNMSYGIEGPGPYYIGYSKGHVKEYATFEQKNRADMEAAFDRFYTQRQLTELEFDLLKLKFHAQVRRCVTIVGTKTNAARVHLCEDNDRPKQLEEEWYFIGDTRSRDHGIIADGAFPGLTGFTQVIRGRYNYNRMWNKYKEEDIKLVLEEVGETRGLTYAFKRYLNEDSKIPYENFVDNSHPGLYVVPRY
ncbi:MAG: hypothetical protein CME70_14375 [Halobacteriovorax sp.]|nr:hypothetical protein [Halobacteriovorax sp.]|tara:strand:- start:261201 stop:264443 length:3243 start_codon:yes stop_codon:yes gene_type:complete